MDIMLNAKNISDEVELADILTNCGYSSKPVMASPAWEMWVRQWKGYQQPRRAEPMPCSQYLSDISHHIIVVAIRDDAFQVYEQLQHSGYWLLTCEVEGDIDEQALCGRLKAATSPLLKTPAVASPCICLDSPLTYKHYKEIGFLGEDETHGRFGQVSIKQCKLCGRYWLHYFVEYEHHRGSGRYFMGLISLETARTLKPEAAVDYLNTLDWHLYGGSYFSHAGKSSSEVGPVDD